jgi:glycosyltransferase involved in cell wall biosynthesis
LKVTIICLGFSSASVNLQPWRHVFEIAKGMTLKGWKITVISNVEKELPTFETIAGIDIIRLSNVMLLPIFNKREMTTLFGRIKPDIILWVGKPLSCLSISRLTFIDIPIIWFVETGITSLQNLMELSLREIIDANHNLGIEILNTLFPRHLIQMVTNSSLIKGIIVPSNYLKNWLLGIGVSEKKITIVPSGLDEPYKNSKIIVGRSGQSNYPLDTSFTVVYFGSPCSLRGPDILIKSIRTILDQNILNINCFILSRRKDKDIHLIKDERKLISLVQKLNLENNVKIVSGELTKSELSRFVELSDVVALPFKVLQSETPLAVLEAMSRGKVVVTHKIRTLEDIVGEDRGILIDSSQPEELANAILKVLQNQSYTRKIETNAREFAMSTPSWSEVTQKTISVLEKAVQ